MFGLGGTEIVIIVVVALLIFGPSKLPELAKTIGKAMNEFKKATTEVEEAVKREMTGLEQAADESDVNALAKEAAKDAGPLTPAAANPAERYDDDFDYEDDEE